MGPKDSHRTRAALAALALAAVSAFAHAAAVSESFDNFANVTTVNSGLMGGSHSYTGADDTLYADSINTTSNNVISVTNSASHSGSYSYAASDAGAGSAYHPNFAVKWSSLLTGSDISVDLWWKGGLVTNGATSKTWALRAGGNSLNTTGPANPLGTGWNTSSAQLLVLTASTTAIQIGLGSANSSAGIIPITDTSSWYQISATLHWDGPSTSYKYEDVTWHTATTSGTTANVSIIPSNPSYTMKEINSLSWFGGGGANTGSMLAIDDVTVSVPEPAALGLLALGGTTLTLRRRQRLG